MPSPFPGMNPYLEQEEVWHDFHDRVLPLAAELLNAQAGADYIVKIDERIYIHDISTEQQAFLGRADVAGLPPSGGGVTAAGVVEAPVQVQLPLIDTEREPYLEIRDRRSRRLIIVLELLSPSNKRPGRDREQYIGKREQLMANQVNLVEIDLLRGGPRMPFVDLPCDYCVLVFRSSRWTHAGLWPLRLRDRLPVIPVPLSEPDPDPRLDLQEMLHRIYDAAGYAKFIYDGEPVPPLAAEDAAWAQALAAAR